MSDKFTGRAEVAMLNISRFSELLRTPLDEKKRSTVESLLADEKIKLSATLRRSEVEGRSATPTVQRQEQAMTTLRDTLEKFEIRSAECQMVAELATDNAKRELFLRLALQFRDLAAETRKALSSEAY